MMPGGDSMTRKYDEKLVANLQEHAYLSAKDGMKLIVKPIPEGLEDYSLDPRLYKGLKYLPYFSKALPNYIPNSDRISDHIYPYRLLFTMANNLAMHTQKIKVDHKIIFSSDHSRIPIRIYYKQDLPKNNNILVYIHGGGFFGGSMNVVDHLCKYLADLSNTIVVSIGYRRVPEVHYPLPLEDCLASIRWIYHHATYYKANRENLFIGGDSAGGNLAIASTLKLRDTSKITVRGVLLNYPITSLSNDYFDVSNYQIHMKYQGLFDLTTKYLKDVLFSKDFFAKIYVKDPLRFHDPYANVIEANLVPFPATLLISAEFDFLIAQGYQFMKLLSLTQKNYKMIVYRGLSHGFIDQLGYLPQAEDAVHEMVFFIQQYRLKG